MQISSVTASAPTELADADRVRLLPQFTLLRRDDREIQLGFDTTDAVVLADPDGSLSALLTVMDGRYRRTDLATIAPQFGVSVPEFDTLLTALTSAGLLEAPGPPMHSRCTVRLVGLGPAGTQLGEQLLRAGLGRLLVVDAEHQVPWARWPTDRDRVQRTEHWSLPYVDGADLTVIVASCLEVDRAISSTLTQADHPHLIVRPRARGAVVGPLVIPGRTSCLHCGDLARTRTDPAWPRMLAQLCRIDGDWDPLAANWAASEAATQVLGHLAGRPVASAAATLELGPADWQWRRRLWPADPACGCSWSAE
ncbi:MAG: hypothetical protein QM650_12025 [Microlunatus sp.]